MFAPAKTPRDIVERLNRETVAVLARGDVREKLSVLGGEPMAMSPSEFDAYIKEKIALNAELVKAAGIKPE
jgi:tripartite-type tricarboxylate transporter receptor subunit TctC